MTDDEIHMQQALRLAHRALGTTAENPPVGCLIVKENKVLGIGWTQPGGRPHAETEALAMAGEAARGATAYVTLEPCSHHGRSPPCAEALVKAGISRVVTALEDPDPRVKGRGHALLRTAGVDVLTGIGGGEARGDLAGFFSRIERKSPYVTLKLAISADGKIAARKGERTRITGDRARARVHLMRAQSDAILVGVGTVLVDDPSLLCELPCLGNRSPIRLIADSKLSIPRDAVLVRTATDTPTWILTTVTGEVGAGVEVISCRGVAEGRVDLADAVGKLAGRGINRLMVEGGAVLARSLLDAGLIDEVVLFQAPTSIGGQGVDAIAGLPLAAIPERFRLIAQETLGSDALSLYGRV
jgi:diaminohydroxyphosphoribosylaminopyrimidine deaminase/5-amino-6-(5-phosphoribosylamino)uracil reductase